MSTPPPLAAVVLAAGQGKRMKSPLPKVLIRLEERALVEHVLAAVAPLGADPVVVVYGHGGEAVREALSGRGLRFALQPEQRGTGHALSCALQELEGFSGDVLVVCGDTPLLSAPVLKELVESHRGAGRALTLLSATVERPGSLGRILRGPDGRLAAVREAADATAEERAVREINTGVLVIASRILPGALARLTPDNAQGEYYLTDVPALLLADGLEVDAHETGDAASALGVNTPEDLEAARHHLLLRRKEAARGKDRIGEET